MFRRTRIVCVSDTHNASPAHGAFALPKGDVLIHAGDLTKQGTFAELQKTVAWIAAADFEAKVVVAGNHDLTLDPDFYTQYGAHFHNQTPQDIDACRRLLRETSSITYLEDSTVDITLTKDSGPRTRFRIHGSPMSPAKPDQRPWAFQYVAADAEQQWSRIPLDADLVVTHAPPRLHCDDGEGCEELRRALWRVRPRLAICGHVHAARGAERVRWDLDCSNVRFKEYNTDSRLHWDDPSRGTKKQALLDLSARGGNPLRNDGGHLPSENPSPQHARRSEMRSQGENEAAQDSNMHQSQNLAAGLVPDVDNPSVSRSPSASASISPARGLGGRPPSGRCDVAALHGRLGRQETCVVNASIMASSYPYKGKGAERYNKPIVVDIDLPVHDSDQ